MSVLFTPGSSLPPRNGQSNLQELKFSETDWSPEVSISFRYPLFFIDTNLDSFTTRALLNSIMNKILANALQREQEGSRNPPEGESWNKASQLGEAKINKCIICTGI